MIEKERPVSEITIKSNGREISVDSLAPFQSTIKRVASENGWSSYRVGVEVEGGKVAYISPALPCDTCGDAGATLIVEIYDKPAR